MSEWLLVPVVLAIVSCVFALSSINTTLDKIEGHLKRLADKDALR